MPAHTGSVHVHRELLPSRFRMIPDDAYHDPALNALDRDVLGYLIGLAFRRSSYPGHLPAAHELRISRATLCRALDHLRAAGWIRTTAHGPGACLSFDIPDPQRRIPATAAWGLTSETPPSHQRDASRLTSETHLNQELLPEHDANGLITRYLIRAPGPHQAPPATTPPAPPPAAPATPAPPAPTRATT